MSTAKTGDTVKVHYTGKMSDGTVFDSSRDGDPLEFEIGSGRLIPGFENGVIGMQMGEVKTLQIPADQAYGPRNDNLIWEVERTQLPEDLEPEIGQQLQSVQEDGRRINLVITDISESSVTLDANHPLAGKDLVFEVELMAIA